MGQQKRLHVFTFDASGGREYNKNNCQLALERFEKEQGGKFKFWCELGGYGRWLYSMLCHHAQGQPRLLLADQRHWLHKHLNSMDHPVRRDLHRHQGSINSSEVRWDVVGGWTLIFIKLSALRDEPRLCWEFGFLLIPRLLSLAKNTHNFHSVEISAALTRLITTMLLLRVEPSEDLA